MATTSEHILRADADGIATLTINNPTKLNALHKALITELGEHLADIAGDASVKAILLTGSGQKAFAAGADIAEFSAYTPAEGQALSALGHSVFNRLAHNPKPTLAAVNGFALGGGCELAMACHLRIASDNAKFGQPEVNLGLIPGYAGTQRLVELVGRTKAIEMLLTGDAITAEEAHRLGLVNAVVSQDELIPTATAMLQKIMTKGPLAVAHCLHLVNMYSEKDKNGYTAESEAFGNLFGTADFQEGTAAFAERRPAKFIGV